MKSAKLANNQKIFTIIVAAILAAVLLFYLVTFQVRVTQIAVVTTFGKPTQAIKEPGLYWKFPYPFQDYFTFDARVQIFSGKLEQTYTSDSKNIIIETYIGWRIEDPILFLSRAGTIKNAQKNIEAMLRHYMNSVLGKHSFKNLVSVDPKDIQLANIESDVKKLLNDGLQSDGRNQMAGVKSSMGIVVDILGIQRLELPKDTTKAVFDRMKEERNRSIQSFRSKGEGKAKEIRAQADAKREETLIEAQAEAKRRRGKGDAAAAEYYAIFEKDQDLALWLRKLDSLQKLLSENNKITIVLDTRTSPFDLLHDKFNLNAKDKNNSNEKENAKKIDTPTNLQTPTTNPSDSNNNQNTNQEKSVIPKSDDPTLKKSDTPTPQIENPSQNETVPATLPKEESSTTVENIPTATSTTPIKVNTLPTDSASSQEKGN